MPQLIKFVLYDRTNKQLPVDENVYLVPSRKILKFKTYMCLARMASQRNCVVHY